MLILLVLAKGWAVTRTELTSKPLIFTIWAVYGVINILLYVWNLVRNSLGFFTINIALLFIMLLLLICWFLWLDGSRRCRGYWRISNMARMADSNPTNYYYDVVCVWTQRHDGPRASTPQIKFFPTFWCSCSRVVHLFTYCCTNCVTSLPIVAFKTFIG